MVTRRVFLKFGSATGTGIVTPWGAILPQAHAQTPAQTARFAQVGSPSGRVRAPSAVVPLDPRSLSKYADPLPFPIPVAQPVGNLDGADYYEIGMTQIKQRLHKQLGPTTLWSYGDAPGKPGMFPGPTIQVRAGQRIFVKWVNQLAPAGHLLEEVFDTNLHGTDRGEPHVKTVVHVHGAHVPPHSDGHPEAWFTRNFARKGDVWSRKVYEYPNLQAPTTLWYHDHAIGQTRLNVYAGLFGFFLVRRPGEREGDDHDGEQIGLPGGRFEVPLVIFDRQFEADGSLLYPVRDPDQIPTGPDHPGPWVPEFFGDTILVNGKVWPYFAVEPRRYRLRILNGSNARFYNLRLSSGQPFFQIGAEQGLFPFPVRRTSILLAPAERADVIVDFSGQANRDVFLTNDAPAPYPAGDPVDPDTTAHVMKFSVSRPMRGNDASVLPARLDGAAPALELGAGYVDAPTLSSQLQAADASPAGARRVARIRHMALAEVVDADDNPIIVLLNNRHWDDPITDKPRLGSIEVWHLINTTGDTHPIHLHLVKFLVLRRQTFDVDGYLAAWHPTRPGMGPAPIPATPYLTGRPMPPDTNEIGFKDTVRVNPGEVATIAARFDDYTGNYPWHCHILEHEDNEMMLQFEVVP